MTGFLIKKCFHSLRRNILRIVLLNLGFMVSLTLAVSVPFIFIDIPSSAEIVVLFGALFGFVYLSAAAMSLKAVSDYGSFGFAGFFNNLKGSWPAGLAMGFTAFLAFILMTRAIPYYLSMNSMAGLLSAAFIFWALVALALSLQFFFAVRARLETKLPKILKKCFLVFWDSPIFCISTLIHNCIILALSFIGVFLFPGPAGMLLFLDEALRLRLLMYLWLEDNPGENGRVVPWDIILKEEREKLVNY